MKNLTSNASEDRSIDLVANNVEALRKLFPDAFTENGVDFEVLKQLLGGDVDTRDEKYGLNWHGKRAARTAALTPSTNSLRPCPDASLDWDDTQNVVIEGDNLEALKLLQEEYAAKVQLIYIDPPYNTGKDFVYADNFEDSLATYLRYTRQVDGPGRKVATEAETRGRFHTNWLNMMYPRLMLARQLLRDDGVLFASCDDSEIHELKQILCEIFGEENILGMIANVHNPKGRSDDRFIATAHEYLVVAAKDASLTKWGGFEPDHKITRRYNKRDETGAAYREIDLRKTGDSDRRVDRPEMYYSFYHSRSQGSLRVSKERNAQTGDEIEIVPVKEDGSEGRWRWGFATANERLSSLLVRYMPQRKMWGVFEKDYLEGRSRVKPTSAWTFKDVNSERGSEQFIELGFPKEAFPRPKPLGTMQRILEIATSPEQGPQIVLDFFAGSGTMGQAVMERNARDGGKRRYVLVQLPEPLDPQKKEQKVAAELCDALGLPRTLAEITKERLRRAAAKLRVEFPTQRLDLGFRVYEIAQASHENVALQTEGLGLPKP